MNWLFANLATIVSVITAALLCAVGLAWWVYKRLQQFQEETDGENFWRWVAGEVLKELRRLAGIANEVSATGA